MFNTPKMAATIKGMLGGETSASVIGGSPNRTRIILGNQTIAEEVPSPAIKGIGRNRNNQDNMSRTFHVNGFSTKTKLNMWDLLSHADTYQKQLDDQAYTNQVKNR